MGYTHVLDRVEEATNHHIKAYMIEPNYINYQGKNTKIGVESAQQLVDEVAKLVSTDEQKFVFGYWTDPDKTMHESGCYSAKTKEKMTEINELLMNLSQQMKDTL